MIDLAIVKSHLRVRHALDDAYIQDLIDAAAQSFNDQTNRTLIAQEQSLPEPAGNALKINKAIQQGMLLLIGHWYVNRELSVIGAIASELPKATDNLWQPYRWSNV